MLVIILFFTALALIVKNLWDSYKDALALSGKLPGPKAWPIIGNMLMFAVPQKQILRKFYKVHSKYDSPVRYWLGPKLHICIDKAEDIQVVMESPMTSNKGDLYQVFVDCIGFGLIQSNGQRHKIHRKLMALPLRARTLGNQVGKFDSHARECAEAIAPHAGGKPFNIIHNIEDGCMNMVCDVIMDVRIHSNSPENLHIKTQIQRVYKTIADRIYKVWLHPLFLYKFTEAYRIQKDGVSLFNIFMDKAIVKKKNDLLIKERKSDIEDDDDNQTSLEFLLSAVDSYGQKKFSETEVREEMATLFTASEDTTISITSFTALMLAMHQDIQQKVYEEQEDIYGKNADPNIPIQADHLNEMTYLHMVLQEVLRLFPIAPLMARKVSETFKMGDLTIPKDTDIMIYAYHTHRNPKYWKDPLKFDPTRFTTEEKAKRHPYCYIPFSGGIRGCIGKVYAYMSMKSIISHIVRRYTLHSDWTMDNIEIETDVSVRSTNGYMVQIKHRPHLIKNGKSK